jgi:hypothetical protein
MQFKTFEIVKWINSQVDMVCIQSNSEFRDILDLFL